MPTIPCTCPAKEQYGCNLANCQQEWAVKERKQNQPNVFERVYGFIAVLWVFLRKGPGN
jgi:hypothetical protein